MTICQDKSFQRRRQIWKFHTRDHCWSTLRPYCTFLSCQYVYFINSHDISPWISVFVFLLWVTRQILLKVDQRVASLASLAAVRRPASPTSLQIGVKLQWRNVSGANTNSFNFVWFLGHSLFYGCFLRHYNVLEQEDRIPIREEAITRKKDQTAICSELQGTENGAGKELVSWF